MLHNQISLKDRNTFGFSVKAKHFVQIANAEQLRELWQQKSLWQEPFLILGGGSNILFTKDFEGLVLYNQIKGKRVIKEDEQHIWIQFGAGENWHESVIWAVENGWGGIENMSLIPGTCGAAPIQNIGAYGVELKDVFEELEAFDVSNGETRIFKHQDCKFGYRDSVFKNSEKGKCFILSITLKLSKHPTLNTNYGDIQTTLEQNGVTNPGIKDVSNAVIHIRTTKLPDPAVLGNCGSFFKNPVVQKQQLAKIQMEYPHVKSFEVSETEVKIPAAWLIETAGWKGYRTGDAGVHEKQALVLVNYGNAVGNDIKILAEKIQADVLEKFGVQLEMEVNIL